MKTVGENQHQGLVRVAHFLPDLAIGGGQEVLLRLIRAADPSRLRFDVFSFGPDREMCPDYETAGATIHELNGADRRGTSTAVVAACRERGIDIVHTHGTPEDRYFGQHAARVLSLPLVTTLHGMRPRLGSWPRRPRALLRRLDYLRGRARERRADRRLLRAVIAVSAAVRDDWREELARIGLTGQAVHVIPSGLVLDDYAPMPVAERAALRGSFGIAEADRVVILVSRLIESKNVRVVVPTFAQVLEREPGARLLIVGPGPDAEFMRQQAARAGIDGRVLWLGARRDVPRLLQMADVLLFPSTTEGFGLAVLEALAAGVPVVSYALPSLDSLRDQGAQIRFVDESTPAAFGNAIGDLIVDADSRQRSIDAGRRVVAAHWDARATARHYLDAYERVLGR